MKRTAIALSLLLFLAGPAVLLAHEGHDHRLMGTVAAVEHDHLKVETRDGKTVSIVLSGKTKYLRGSTPVTVEEITVGDRIVVTVADEKGVTVASEILLADPKKAGPPKD